MNIITYYRATCGSLYRVTTTPGTRLRRATVILARRSIHARLFSPPFETSAEEVSRLVSIDSFVEVPAP
ncbi:MAG: hypothetical protein ACRYFV_15655 [Janthinobacterium lividum]